MKSALRPGKPVTRADLAEAIYKKVGLSRAETSTLVELLLQQITDALQRGETVKLPLLGSFVVRKRGKKIRRSARNIAKIQNPKKGPTSVKLSDIKKAVLSSYAAQIHK